MARKRAPMIDFISQRRVASQTTGGSALAEDREDTPMSDTEAQREAAKELAAEQYAASVERNGR